MLLTIAELPGVYAHPDTGEVWSLDHVEARMEDSRLVLHNPTPNPAEVRVLVEDSTAARTTPMSEVNLQVVALAPGESTTLS